MKKVARRVLEEKLHTAIEGVLMENNAEYKNKTKKAVNKSIKRISRKTDFEKEVVY